MRNEMLSKTLCVCVCVCVKLQKPKISYSFFPPPNVIGIVLRVLGSLQRISKCFLVCKMFFDYRRCTSFDN